mmetsp:Transcript_16721/g.39716  ORF Transcript_16721/g.39716 Transcript_16721/m.39716 type:complete len:222 (-) Transcript_16721:52-717(-)
MRRHYDTDKLKSYFNYSHGAYAQSGPDGLMPNIAIYCRTPIRSPDGKEFLDVHVINVIGFAFDSEEQPDYQYFLASREPGRREELVQKMQQMWRYIFVCAKEQGLKRVFLAGVGGGAFSTYLRGDFAYRKLKEESLGPVLREFQGIEVRDLPRVPDWVFTDEGRRLANSSLLVNAWDPWSMVGNGNAADNSLDGFFGRSTAMALLCWPVTNPNMQFVPVAS